MSTPSPIAWVDTLYTLRLIGSSASVAGSCFVLILSVILKRWRDTMHVRLVGMCLLSVMLEAISELMGDQRDNADMCTTQAVISTFADWCCSMYVAVIAFNVYRVIVKENYHTEKQEYRYHLVTFSIAAIFTTLPGVIRGNQYGPAGAWCWIVDRAVILRFVCWYFPLLFIFIFVLVTYIIVLRQLRSSWRDLPATVRPSQGEVQIKIARRLTIYPIIFLVVWALPLASRVYDWLTGDVQLPWLATSAATVHSLQGLLYSLAYGFDSEMMRRMRYSAVYLKEMCGGGPRGGIEGDLRTPFPRQLDVSQDPDSDEDERGRV